jgi:threonine dehydrogenase-like Zn-dependent dehydrogenase
MKKLSFLKWTVLSMLEKGGDFMKTRAVFFTDIKKLEIREIDLPDPGSNQIQVKSIVNGICMFEVWKYISGEFDRNDIPGHEGVGIVTKVGKDVTWVKEGDYVSCNQWSEYSNIDATQGIKLSCDSSNSENHLVEPLSCAVNAYAYTDIYPGDKVIVFGAGYMGLLLIQLLGHAPLHSLVVVDAKTENLELAKEYGATEVINITDAVANARLEELKDYFDIAYEASGAKSALEWCTKLHKNGGSIGLYAWHHDPRTVDTSTWHYKGTKVLNVSPPITANERPLRSYEGADLLMASGKVSQKKLITHRYKFEDIEKAMEESVARGEGFIKSLIEF